MGGEVVGEDHGAPLRDSQISINSTSNFYCLYMGKILLVTDGTVKTKSWGIRSLVQGYRHVKQLNTEKELKLG